jgi:hypothetical protein
LIRWRQRHTTEISIDFFASTQKRDLDFNLAYIPADFKPNPKEIFDIKEMQRLFKRGYDDAIHGYSWHKIPPDYAAEDEKSEKTG